MLERVGRVLTKDIGAGHGLADGWDTGWIRIDDAVRRIERNRGVPDRPVTIARNLLDLVRRSGSVSQLNLLTEWPGLRPTSGTAKTAENGKAEYSKPVAFHPCAPCGLRDLRPTLGKC